MLNPSASHTPPTKRFPWQTTLMFAVGVLLLGMVDALVTMLVFQGNPAKNAIYRNPPIWPPDWVFWVVWIVIYPCLGVATALIWKQRFSVPVGRAIAFFVVLLSITLIFLPLSSAINGNPAGLTMMDTTAFLFAYATAWAYRRVTQNAVWWLVPLLIWTPVTLLLKIWYWHLNV